MSKSKKIWYAIYVRSRAEKKVALELDYDNISFYLPMVKRLKQWSDRKKWVEEPLFRSYIFVNIELKDFYKVLQTIGVVKYVTFENKAVSIPEIQITAIKHFLQETDPENFSEEKWKIGKRVEVISGSMMGLLGDLVEFNGKHKVRIEIEAVRSSFMISIKKSLLRVI